MNEAEKKKITKIAKQFASGFKPDIPSINRSGWLIVDPLSGYLSAVEGIENKLQELPATEKHPQVLVMIFKDGTRFVPAGGDLKPLGESAHNWMWVDPIPSKPAPTGDKSDEG